jgi:hypothetical protein
MYGLEHYEQAHGIRPGMLYKAGWREGMRRGRPCLSFPTESGTRYRFTDDEKPKYDQDIGYAPCWYGLQRATLRRLPFLIECNGAASTVAAESYGLPAYSLQAGEVTVPSDDLIAQLSAYRRKIYLALDCDASGRRGAIKRAQVYQSHGLEVEVLDLQLPIDGGDLADFVALHPDDALKALLACPRLTIPDPEPRRERKEYAGEDRNMAEQVQRALDVLAAWRCDVRDSWVEIGMAVHAALGEEGFALWDTWSQRSEKYSPRAALSTWKSFRKSGIGAGTLFGAADEDYGPSWRPDWKSRPVEEEYREAPDREPPPEPEAPYWPGGLPIAIRATLNAYGHSSLAPTLEVINEAIALGLMQPDDVIDVKFITCIAEVLGRNLNRAAVRSGLKLGAGQFLVKLQHYIDPDKDSTLGVEDQTISQEIACSLPGRAGRKADLYRLLPKQAIIANVAKLAVAPILQKAFPLDQPTLAPIRAEFLVELGKSPDEAEQLKAQLEARYGAQLEAQPGYLNALNRARREFARLVRSMSSAQSAPIPAGWKYERAVDYVACCARAVIEAHGGQTQFGRATLCALIGCSQRNLNTCLKRAGIGVEKDQFSERTLRSVDELAAIQPRFDKNQGGFPVALKSSKVQVAFPFGEDGMQAWVTGEISRGATVVVRYQQAHRQVIASERQPSQEPKQEPPAKPRLTYCQLLVLKALLDALCPPVPVQQALFAPPSPITPEATLNHVLDTLARWLQVERIKAIVNALLSAWRDRPQPPKRKVGYAEGWQQRLVATCTDWTVQEGKLIDRSTGVIEEYSVQLSFEVLLGAEQ